MRTPKSRLRTPAAALAVLALVGAAPAAVAAEDDPVEKIRQTVQDTTEQVTGGVEEVTRTVTDGLNGAGSGGSSDAGGTGGLLEQAPSASTSTSVPSQDAPAPSSDDDSPGHETPNPSAPDHGQATMLDAGVAGEDVATVGDDRATVRDNDSTRADSTLLALGGQEVIGAHADSNGTGEDHFGDPLAPLCEGSDGAACLTVLYADAWASEEGRTSHSESQSGVADVCLGGDSTDPTAECAGPAYVGVANNHAEAHRNQTSGRTTASSSSDLAEVCLERDEVTGACAVGVGALHSSGEADSGNSPGSATRESYLLALDVAGEEQLRVEDAQAVSLPPECPEGTSLLCLFLNQGETYLGDGLAGHAQDALHLKVLPGIVDLELVAADTETLVHNDGGEPLPADEVLDDQRDRGGDGDVVAGVGAGGPGNPGATIAGVGDTLPNTGGVWSGLLAIALSAIGIGLLMTARARRLALAG